MQLSITFPDSGFPDLLFTATCDSLVKEASQTAADEWGVVASEIDIIFNGSLLPSNTKLVSHGIENDSELVVFVQRFEIDPLTVLVRVRPLNSRELLLEPQTGIKIKNNSIEVLDSTISRTFEFENERMFCNCQSAQDESRPIATQETIFQEAGAPAVSNALSGYNTCIFAYGNTGTGKTYTMIGLGNELGLTPRILEFLFSEIEGGNIKGFKEHVIEISFLEIYNETLRDLLSLDHKERLRIRKCHINKTTHVEGLTKLKVHSVEEAMLGINRGVNCSHMQATLMGTVSSRSHKIIEINIRCKNPTAGVEQHSKITLVDLAGSERSPRCIPSIWFGEAMKINKSLSCLRKMIDILSNSTSRKTFVPYRDSMLTFILSDCFGGNCKTTMIATLSPSSISCDDNVSTLRFSLMGKNVINRVRVNNKVLS